MLRNLATSVGVMATVLTSTMAVPVVASAQSRYDSPSYDRRDAPAYDRRVESRNARARRDYYARNCHSERRSAGNKGTVAGALVGGAAGALIGGDVLGGLVGAGVGAVAGHQIAKGRTRC